MSGGVDSSVAAAMLVREGYDVFGVTMNLRPIESEPDETGRACCSPAAAADARRVADLLGIPHYVLDFSDVFREAVIGDFIEEYRRGRTPNPCVRCNRFVKFEALMEKARALGADRIATGHYARIVFDALRGRWLLKRGTDSSKDQSYALYAMTQEQLARTLMPLGGLTKTETRAIARELGLEVASKAESQDICFADGRDYAGFLSRAAPELVSPGPILDTSGREIGRHRGIAFYTVGQRRRIGIAAREPLYVVEIDTRRNAVVVGTNSELYSGGLVASEMNFVSIERPGGTIAGTAKIRYNMQDSEALLSVQADDTALIRFERPQRAVAPGQAVVFYAGEDVVGGGTIESALR
ncbi:MAG: tRNA 2-thiouridine(34) synthase MnmA [Armatimonadetes bacterium]|nr:tRNA 2-thiouridine(34) synthase MnmA [Armatimonadota bacterium]